MKLVIFTAILFLSINASVFAQSERTVRLKGQVVCSVCWFEADDRKKVPYGNTAYMDCAIDCSEQKIPEASAVEDEKGFTLYTLEPGVSSRRAGILSISCQRWSRSRAKLRTEKDKKVIKVNSLRVLKEILAQTRPGF